MNFQCLFCRLAIFTKKQEQECKKTVMKADIDEMKNIPLMLGKL